MRHRGLGLLDAIADPILDVTPDVDTSGDNVAGMLSDAHPEHSAFLEDVTKLGELTDDAETLEDVAVAMESMLDSGIVTRDMVLTSRMAINIIQRRHGYRPQPQPSLESLEGADLTSMLTASLEGLKETLIRWWQAAMSLINKAWTGFRNWMVKVTDSAPRIKRRAIELKAKARGVAVVVGMELPGNNVSSALAVDGKPVTPDAARQSLTLVDAFVKHALSSRVGADAKASMDDIIETCQFLTDIKNPSDFDFSTTTHNAINGFRITLNDYAKNLSGGHMEPDPTRKTMLYRQLRMNPRTAKMAEGFIVMRSREMLGGKAFIFSNNSTAISKDMLGNITLKSIADLWEVDFVDYDVRRPAMLHPTIVGKSLALDDSEMQSFCDQVISICDSVSAYRSGWAARAAEKDRAMREINRHLSNANDKNVYQRHYLKGAAAAASVLWRKYIALDSKIIAYAIRTVTKILGWVEASVAAFARPHEEPQANAYNSRQLPHYA